MTHDELADSLGAHLRGPEIMVWTNMQLGPKGSPRPDVYTIRKSFTNPSPTAYEVKVSVSDFRSDVTTGKYTNYFQYAGAVMFACEHGLISKFDVPSQCGLIVFNAGSWRAARKPTVSPCTIPQEAALKLLIDGVKREGLCVRAKEYTSSRVHREFCRRFGIEATRYVTDAANIGFRLAEAEQHANRITENAKRYAETLKSESSKDAAAAWSRVTASLGIPKDADPMKIRYMVDRILERIKNPEVVSQLNNTIRYLDGVRDRLEGIATSISEGVR